MSNATILMTCYFINPGFIKFHCGLIHPSIYSHHVYILIIYIKAIRHLEFFSLLCYIVAQKER